jgi:hypothetical protein
MSLLTFYWYNYTLSLSVYLFMVYLKTFSVPQIMTSNGKTISEYGTAQYQERAVVVDYRSVTLPTEPEWSVSRVYRRESRCGCNGLGLPKGCSWFESVLRVLHGTLTEYLQVNSGTEASSNLQQKTLQNAYLPLVNPLKTKRRLLYLKTQSVPRCKHFSSRL